MIYFGKDRYISSVAVSSILGQGNGIFGLMFANPFYQTFCRVVNETDTTVFGKSATRSDHRGNFIMHDPRSWKYVRHYGVDSMINAYNLTNPGVFRTARGNKKAIRQGYRVIPNFYPQYSLGLEVAIHQTIAAIEILIEVLGDDFWAIELNDSCPNAKEKIAENMEFVLALSEAVRKAYPWLIIIHKIGYDHPYELAQELERRNLADAFHSINSIPCKHIFIDCQSSPLYCLKGVNDGGAVSGRAAFKKSFIYTKGLRKKVELPILMGCGIVSTYQADLCAGECIDLGRDSLDICSMGAIYPIEACTLIVKYNSPT